MTDGSSAPPLLPPPASGLTFAQRGLLKAMVGWMTFSVIVASMGVCLWSADWLVLRWYYDEEHIHRERLHIVARKPVRVSNGDDLGRAPWPQPLLFTVGWIGSTAVMLTALTRALPRQCRTALLEKSDAAYESSPVGLWAASLLTSVPLLFLALVTRSWIPPLLGFTIAAGVVLGIRRTFRGDGRTKASPPGPAR